MKLHLARITLISFTLTGLLNCTTTPQITIETLPTPPLEPLVVHQPRTASEQGLEEYRVREIVYEAMTLAELLDPANRAEIEARIKAMLAAKDEARQLEEQLDKTHPQERTIGAVQTLEKLRREQLRKEKLLAEGIDRLFVQLPIAKNFKLNETKIDVNLSPEEVQEISKGCAETGVVILGYGCNIGSDSDNSTITTLRAENMSKLIRKLPNCHGASITPIGKGKDPNIDWDGSYNALSPEQRNELQTASRRVAVFVHKNKDSMKSAQP